MLRKDKIAKFVIVIILIVMVIIGIGILSGVLGTNQTKFIKKLGDMDWLIDQISYSPNANFYRLAKLKNYTKVGTASMQLDGYKGKSIEDVIEQKNSLQINGRVNGSEKQEAIDINWMDGENILLNTKYIRDGEKVALKSDEIVNAYVAVENTNLIDFFQKLDKDLPYPIDHIDLNGFNELFSLEELEKETLLTYQDLLKENTNGKNYIQVEEKFLINGKEKKIKGYQLNLNEEEVKTFGIELCKKLQEDSITLNLLSTKAKLVGVSEEEANVNSLNQKLENLKQGLENKTIQTQNVTITIYSFKNQILSLEITYGQNKIKVTSEYKQDKIYVQWELNNQKSKIEKVREADKIGLYYQNEKQDGNKSDIQIEAIELNTGIQNKFKISLEDNSGTFYMEYEEENKFAESVEDIERLTSNNSVTLNQYSKEELKVLLQAIQAQWERVYQNKKAGLVSVS